MLRRRLMRLIDVAVITIALVFVSGHTSPSPISVSTELTAVHQVCVHATTAHWLPAHTVKRYKDKHGRIHPAHWVTGKTVSGHRAYCRTVNGSRHHSAYCVAPKPAHFVGDHMSKPYTRKGVYHPSHFIAGHEVSARAGYCISAR